MMKKMRTKSMVILIVVSLLLVFLTVAAVLGNLNDKPIACPANPDYLDLEERPGALRFCMFRTREAAEGKLGLVLRFDRQNRILPLQEAMRAFTGVEDQAFDSIGDLLPGMTGKQDLIYSLVAEIESGTADTRLYDESEVEILVPFERPAKLADFSCYPLHTRNMKRALSKVFAPAFYYSSAMLIHNYLANDGWFYPNNFEDGMYHFYGNHIGINGADGDNVKIPEGYDNLDIEPEIAVVIARDGRNISEEDAMDYVAGYCLYNDYSQREIQIDEHENSHFGYVKSKTVNSLGPYVITALDIDKVAVTVKVNGEQMLTCGSEDLFWPVSKVISHASSLEEGIVAGEIIGLGTMSGGSLFEMDLPMLKAGDILEIAANQGLGTIRNRIVE